MISHEAAVAWLKKQARSKDIALYRAIHKPNCSEAEKVDIEDAIEAIDYLLEYVEEKKKQSDAFRLLRLIYADFVEGSSRCREKAEERSKRGQTQDAADLRRDAEIRTTCANRVKIYCRTIGFDPSKGEQDAGVRKKNEDA